MASVIYSYTPSELQELLNNSYSYADVLRKIGLSIKGGNYYTLKKVIKEYELDESKINKNRRTLYSQLCKNTIKENTYLLEDILNGKHPNYRNQLLLKKLIDNNIKEYKCERCGITTWMNQYITLQLHHKDGNNSNHKLDNIEILCPNCHSQTDSYAGRNLLKRKEKEDNKISNNSVKQQGVCLKTEKQKKVNSKIPSRDILKNQIRTMSFLSIGRLYDVSDNTVRKWCDKYNLPRKATEIKKITDEEWEKL